MPYIVKKYFVCISSCHCFIYNYISVTLRFVFSPLYFGCIATLRVTSLLSYLQWNTKSVVASKKCIRPAETSLTLIYPRDACCSAPPLLLSFDSFALLCLKLGFLGVIVCSHSLNGDWAALVSMLGGISALLRGGEDLQCDPPTLKILRLSLQCCSKFEFTYIYKQPAFTLLVT